MDVDLVWGIGGAVAYSGQPAVFVVVDVLSFSTCVEVAVGRGAAVIPCPFGDPGRAQALAEKFGAELAGRRTDKKSRYSLSPQTLARAEPGVDIVLPSPNGSSITASLAAKTCFAGCLRNARAVASHVNRLNPGTVVVVAAGERWPDGTLRPALEDFLGAGTILAHLHGGFSPDARVARTAFAASKNDLAAYIRHCPSGQELAEKGFAADVEMAVATDCSDTVPQYVDGWYRNAAL